jgi:hypothetical protein
LLGAAAGRGWVAGPGSRVARVRGARAAVPLRQVLVLGLVLVRLECVMAASS